MIHHINKVKRIELLIWMFVLSIGSCKNEGKTKADYKKSEDFKNQFDNKKNRTENNNEADIANFMNQKLFLIERETDSSYQIGSYQIVAPSSPGSIYGWIEITNTRYTYNYFDHEELLEEKLDIDRIDTHQIYTKSTNGNYSFRQSITPIADVKDKVYILKQRSEDPSSSRNHLHYIAREIDTDSSYVINNYKEKEKRDLLTEYGEEYKSLMETDEIEIYQGSPDYITIKYVLKDHYKNGPKICKGCEVLINKEIVSKSNENLRIFSDRGSIRVSNRTKRYIEGVKSIHKIDNNTFRILLDALPNTNLEDYPKVIFKDRVLLLTQDGKYWDIKEIYTDE